MITLDCVDAFATPSCLVYCIMYIVAELPNPSVEFEFDIDHGVVSFVLVD